MWIPEYLVVKNLQSHTDSKFVFTNGRVTMIKGVNKFDERPKSNGSGKSVFIEGLSIAFTGDPIRKVTTPDLIKNGASSSDIEFKMTNTKTSDVMVVSRTIYRGKGKSGKLVIMFNGDPVKFAHVDDGNKFILDAIGIDKVDLYNYYIISKKKYTSFFYSTDTNKRKLISRFSKANVVDGVFDEIKSDVSKIDDSIVMDTADLNATTGRRDAYQEQYDVDSSATRNALISSLEESVTQKEASISAYNAEIVIHKTKILDLQTERVTISGNLETAKAELRGINKIDFVDRRMVINEAIAALKLSATPHRTNLKESTDLLADVKRELATVNRDLERLEVDLAGTISCPKCEHSFMVKDPSVSEANLLKRKLELVADIAEKEATVGDIELIKADCELLIKDIDDKIGEQNVKMRSLDSEETAYTASINGKKRIISAIELNIDSVESNVNRQRSLISECEDRIESTLNAISSIIDDIEEIRNRKDDKESILAKIVEADELLKGIEARIVVKRAEMASKAKWTEIFKRFNVKLSNMAVKSIEVLTNEILRKMNSNLSLEVDGYKVNRDGTVSDVITANVLRYGIQEGSFFKFSEGEQASMNICATLAMQHLINMGCKSGGMDMMFIDEITESMDSSVVRDVVRSFDTIGRTMVIITHVSDEEVIIDNEVTVVKTSEGSKIL